MTTRNDVTPWLGDAADQMTDEQIDRFIRIWDEIGTRHPDPDEQADRDAALSAAVQYLLGEITPADAGIRVDAARRELDYAMVAARQVAIMALEDGASENALHRDLRVTRRTLRLWQGKAS